MGALDDAIRRAQEAADAADAAARRHTQEVDRLQAAVDDFLRRMHAAGDPGIERNAVAVGPGPDVGRSLRSRAETRMMYADGWKLFGEYGPALTVDGRWSEIVPASTHTLGTRAHHNWKVAIDGYHPLRGGLQYDRSGRPTQAVTLEGLELALAQLLLRHGAE